MKSGLYKNRAKVRPEIPESIDAIVLDGNWIICDDGRRFLLHHSSDMIIFCSDYGLTLLSKSNQWQGDELFQVHHFYQFYTIHGFLNNEMIPCAFSLLTGKSEIIYKQLIRELKEGALAIG